MMRDPGTTAGPSAEVSWRIGARSAIRALASVSAVIALYYLVPMRTREGEMPVLLLGTALALTVALGVLQIRAIISSPRPSLRAIEALAFSIPLLILTFAWAYFLMSQSDPASFTVRLTRTDALYFALTVFATVGFGDITPVGQTARLVVASQMFIDLIVLGVGLRVVIGAVQLGRERQASRPG